MCFPGFFPYRACSGQPCNSANLWSTVVDTFVDACSLKEILPPHLGRIEDEYGVVEG
jgi:hypothetical protein